MIGNYKYKQVVHCNLNHIYMAMAFNPGAVLVLHAPRSCSHIPESMRQYFKECFYYAHEKKLALQPNNLFVTGISDTEAIFGGEKLLETCLRDVASKQCPDYILVVPGCTAGVIGDDVTAVAQLVEKETGVPVIPVPGAGFMNNQDEDGLLVVSRLLIQRFTSCSSQLPRKKTAVIFGCNFAINRSRIRDSYQHIFAGFGYQVIFPPTGMRLPDFAVMGQTGIVVSGTVNQRQQKAYNSFAETFARQIGAPCVLDALPDTPQAIFDWVEKIGVILDNPEAASLLVRDYKAQLAEAADKWQSAMGKYSYWLSIGTPPYVYRPENVLEKLRYLPLECQGFILLSELNETHFTHYAQYLKKYALPIYTEIEYQQRNPSPDFVVTSIPKPMYTRQLCLSGMQSGVVGILHLWSQLAFLLREERSIVYEE